ncbi:MAG: hypothetical protein QOF50_33, partial [Gaiellaceae bacterium]|nr:hypothetical protein [Gaiellaceae bacterium]
RDVEQRARVVEGAEAPDPAADQDDLVSQPLVDAVKDAFDGGLVDLNHASERALTTLPGVDKRLAHQIVLIRSRIGGFSSLYDAGSLLDIAPGLVDDLRDRVVCLPL